MDKNKIDPKKYNDLIKNIEILDIKLRQLSCKNSDDIFDMEESNKIKITIKSKVESIEKLENLLIFKKSFTVIGKSKNKTLLNIKAVYEIIYAKNKEIWRPNLLAIANLNVPVNVWPFFRELCYSLTSRMGIPALTLPVRRGINVK